MNRNRIARTAVLLGALAVCLCVSAAAADTQEGVYGVSVESAYSSVVTITPQAADGTEVTAQAANINGTDVSGFYPGAVKLALSYAFPGEAGGSQYLVLALSDLSGVPTEGNIAYIDQAGTGETNVTFTLYPEKLHSGKTYGVYLSSSADSGITTLTKVAQFQYYAPYTLGDVDEDGRITATDARYALTLSVGSATTPKGTAWTQNQRLAAEVDGKAPVTATDARYILEAAVGKRHF